MKYLPIKKNEYYVIISINVLVYIICIFHSMQEKKTTSDGSDSGSATVSQLEIFNLTHQPEFCKIHVQFM